MWIALVILSLSVSALLAFEGLRMYRLLMTLGESTRLTLTKTANDIERLRAGRFELSVPIKHDVPVKMRVPFRHKLEVPIETTVPVSQEVKTTVDVRSLGFSVPLEVTVPLDLTVPIEMKVPIEINRRIAVSTVVPIDFTIPVTVELSNGGFGKGLARVRDDVLSLEAELAATLGAAKFRMPAAGAALVESGPGKAARGMARRLARGRRREPAS